MCCSSVSHRQSHASWFPVTTVDEQPAEHGIRGAVLRIGGRNAFGWLHGETGIHRLVRMSPFDATVIHRCALCHAVVRVHHESCVGLCAQGKRHTSFARVLVLPDMEQAGEGVCLSVCIPRQHSGGANSDYAPPHVCQQTLPA